MRSIKQPISEIFDACQALSAAVDAHLTGRADEAAEHFRTANCPKVWAWVNPACSRPDLNVRVKSPPVDTKTVPKALRDPDRLVQKAIRQEVLARDGYRCRYCGIPVVRKEVRALANELYPEAVPWVDRDPSKQHAGFQCLWLQYDHVVPHSHGGRSTADNVVISCALCNFGKDRYTLNQLGLEDPRLRPVEWIDWDGLERLTASANIFRVMDQKHAANRVRSAAKSAAFVGTLASSPSPWAVAYFLPGAWISRGYVYSPEIDGKERWFKIGRDISAEPAEREGVSGVRLFCLPQVFHRRGIEPSRLRDYL